LEQKAEKLFLLRGIIPISSICRWYRRHGTGSSFLFDNDVERFDDYIAVEHDDFGPGNNPAPPARQGMIMQSLFGNRIAG
jgi:hypothetical protein